MDVTQAQLFIDDEIIEHQTLLERVLHQPARPRGNPVLCPEKPWEGESIAFCAGVYRVSETGGYRMWYATSGVLLGGYTHCICVAESDDGVSWRRPELDFYREAAGGPSNIVWATDQVLDGPTVLHDPADSDRPWKLVFYRGGSVFVGTSPDGLRWEMPGDRERPVLPEFGDRTTALHDAGSPEPIVILSRDGRDMRAVQKVRCIYRIGLSDARTIRSRPELVLRPDLEDGPYVEFYQMSAFRYESVYLGLIERYHTAEPPFADVELAVSRDTRAWRRVRPRRPFLAPPAGGRELGAFDAACATPANSPPLRIGDKPKGGIGSGALFFYYYGRPSFHGDRHMTHAGCIGIAKLRIDGFASLRAGRRQGSVKTTPFNWPGGTLQVNGRVMGGNLWRYEGLDDADGWVRVEVLDESGRVHAGLSADECLPLYRESTTWEPEWGQAGQRALARLTGTRIKLRFHMRAAELYSFRAA